MNPKPNPPSLWPYSIIGFFVLALVFLVGFVVWTMRQREDLVAVNYYENEILYQKQINRLNQSQAYETLPIVTYDVAKRSIVISLPNAQAAASGHVQLYRPSDARLDRELPLAVNSEGVQLVDAKPLPAGLWKVRVQWTNGGKEYYCDRTIVVPG